LLLEKIEACCDQESKSLDNSRIYPKFCDQETKNEASDIHKNQLILNSSIDEIKSSQKKKWIIYW
jgi:hypothetical protein